MELSLGDAFDAWCRGEDISHHTLFGLAVYWWGRIGTLVQVLSAAYVLVELIGASRLREVGLSLRSVLGEDAVRRRAFHRSHWLALHVRWLLAPSNSKEEEEMLEASTDSPYDHLNTVLSIIVTGASIYWAWPNYWLVAGAIPLGMFVLVFVMPLVTIGLTGAAHKVGVLTDRFLVYPLVRLLEHKDLSRILTLASLLLLIIGTGLSALAG